MGMLNIDEHVEEHHLMEIRYPRKAAVTSENTPKENRRLIDPLFARMKDGTVSTAIQVIGDSTGDSDTKWPTLLARSLGAAYPAWTVKVRLFSGSTQKYGAATAIQTGPLGDRYFDGSTGTSTRYLPASQSVYLSGAIDVSVKMRMASWIPSAQVQVFGKSGNPGARGFYGYISTGGYPTFAYSTDGTALATMSATSATGITDNTDYWVRWVFTPDDGGGNRVFKAYKSANGATWTQIGTTVTTPGAVTVFNNSTIGFECGGVSANSDVPLDRLYEIEIRDGEDGKIVAPVLPDLWPPKYPYSAYFTGSPTLTIVNGSVAGGGITGGANLSDSTRLPKLLPDYGQSICILSTSHNDGSDHGRSYRATYGTWVDAVKALLPGVPIAFLTQNPEKSGSTWYREHAKRRMDILSIAATRQETAIDTYQRFLENPYWATDYMTDNVHPNASGQSVLLEEIMEYIKIK